MFTTRPGLALGQEEVLVAPRAGERQRERERGRDSGAVDGAPNFFRGRRRAAEPRHLIHSRPCAPSRSPSLPFPLSPSLVRFGLPIPAFLRGGASPASSSAPTASSSPTPRRRGRPNPAATLALDASDAIADEDYEGQFEEAELDQDFSVKRIAGDGKCMFRALVSEMERGGREGKERERGPTRT